MIFKDIILRFDLHTYHLKCLWNEIFFRRIIGRCVNMKAWYEKLAKMWILNRQIKFKVTCLPLKSGDL